MHSLSCSATPAVGSGLHFALASAAAPLPSESVYFRGPGARGGGGSGRIGQGRVEPGRAGPGRAGPGWAGSGRVGPGRAGPGFCVVIFGPGRRQHSLVAWEEPGGVAKKSSFFDSAALRAAGVCF